MNAPTDSNKQNPIAATILVIMAAHGYRTFVVLPPTRAGAAGLMLTFFNEGNGDVALVPTLVTTDPHEYAPWRDAPFSTQAVIDACSCSAMTGQVGVSF